MSVLSSDVSLNHSQETTLAAEASSLPLSSLHLLVVELMPDVEGYSEASGKEEATRTELLQRIFQWEWSNVFNRAHEVSSIKVKFLPHPYFHSNHNGHQGHHKDWHENQNKEELEEKHKGKDEQTVEAQHPDNCGRECILICISKTHNRNQHKEL